MNHVRRHHLSNLNGIFHFEELNTKKTSTMRITNMSWKLAKRTLTVLIILQWAETTTSKPLEWPVADLSDLLDETARIDSRETKLESDVGSSRYEPDAAAHLNEPCPLRCNCYGFALADCTNANFTQLPSNQNRYSAQGEGSGSATEGRIFSISLQQLYLGFNSITSLPDDCMLEYGGRLTALFLQNNSIADIQARAFVGLLGLKYLDLSYNLIETLVGDSISAPQENHSATVIKERALFAPLNQTLLSLQLSSNRIRSLPESAFAGLSKLKVLSLSDNRISWIGERAFADLFSLRVLTLRGNPLGPTTLARMDMVIGWLASKAEPMWEGHYSQCPGEEELSISVRSAPLQEEEEEEDKVEVRKRRRRQALGGDSLQILNLGRLGLESVPLYLPNSLQILMLDGNNISEISPGTFKNVRDLQLLHLSGNNLREIPDGAFRYSYQLRLMDLSKNHLEVLTPQSFCGLMTLQSLRLYNNPTLRVLPEKIFSKTRLLRLLYLQDCGLHNLPKGPWIHRLRGIWLTGNPLNCSCYNIAPLVTKLRHPKRPRRNNLQLDPFRNHIWDDGDTWNDQSADPSHCASPPTMKGCKVKNIRLRQLTCAVSEWMRVTINRRLGDAEYSFYQGDDDSTYQLFDYGTSLDSAGNEDSKARGDPKKESSNASAAQSDKDNATSYEVAAEDKPEAKTESRWVIEIPMSSEIHQTEYQSTANGSQSAKDTKVQALLEEGMNTVHQYEGQERNDNAAEESGDGREDFGKFEEVVAGILGSKRGKEFRRLLDGIDLRREWMTYYDHGSDASFYGDEYAGIGGSDEAYLSHYADDKVTF